MTGIRGEQFLQLMVVTARHFAVHDIDFKSRASGSGPGLEIELVSALSFKTFT